MAKADFQLVPCGDARIRAMGAHSGQLFSRHIHKRFGIGLLTHGALQACADSVGVLIGTLPIVSAAFTVIALGERPTRRSLASTGVFVAAVPTDTFALGATIGKIGGMLGTGLVLVAVGCAALFILQNKRLRAPIEALPLSILMRFLGLVFAVVVALFTEHPWALRLSWLRACATEFSILQASTPAVP